MLNYTSTLWWLGTEWRFGALQDLQFIILDSPKLATFGVHMYCICYVYSYRPTGNKLHPYIASRDNLCAVGGDGGCRVGEVRAGTTSPMPDHKGFKLQ